MMARPGSVGTYEVVVEDRHTAHAVGNVGVRVLSTPMLTHFCGLAARNAVARGLAEGKVAVPLRATVTHLKASPPGARIQATARVTGADGGRIDLDVEAREGRETVMRGTQAWTIEDRSTLVSSSGC